MEERRDSYRVLMRKPEGKRPLEIPRHRWEDIIMHFYTWNGGMDWIDLAQNTDMSRVLVNVVMNLRVSLNIANFLTS
jgi:hypothetical protein